MNGFGKGMASEPAPERCRRVRPAQQMMRLFSRRAEITMPNVIVTPDLDAIVTEIARI